MDSRIIRYRKVPEVIFRKIEVLKEEKVDFESKMLSADKLVKSFLWLQKFALEKLVTIFFSSSLKIINYEIVTGTVNSANPIPREILRSIILSNASGFALIHNHPSGDESPSREDQKFLDKMKLLGNEIEIHLTDFIIIGDKYFSFAERGLL